ncbi:hypothetical protein ISO18_17090 [Burkholderia pseudomultivorans]|nr:hypothetical protein [Burkholderia pseudomultivorans]
MRTEGAGIPLAEAAGARHGGGAMKVQLRSVTRDRRASGNELKQPVTKRKFVAKAGLHRCRF